MPKLNAVLMVVLAVAVIATAGFLSLEKSAPPQGPDPKETELLLRKLSDGDPDLRREAEAKLRTMGARAVEPLREAARSTDRMLAERAAKLLREIEPVPAEVVRAPEPPEPEPAPEVRETVEFDLRVHPQRAKVGEPVELAVSLVNNSSQPVLLARARQQWAYWPMGAFEVKDSKGKTTSIKPDLLRGYEPCAGEITAVKPGERLNLFAKTGSGYVLLPEGLQAGTYEIRFVYDARDESGYRVLVKASSEGVPLPPLRFVSNSVTVTVAE